MRYQINIRLSEEEYRDLLNLLEIVNNSLTLREKITKTTFVKYVFLQGMKALRNE